MGSVLCQIAGIVFVALLVAEVFWAKSPEIRANARRSRRDERDPPHR